MLSSEAFLAFMDDEAPTGIAGLEQAMEELEEWEDAIDELP